MLIDPLNRPRRAWRLLLLLLLLARTVDNHLGVTHWALAAAAAASSTSLSSTRRRDV